MKPLLITLWLAALILPGPRRAEAAPTTIKIATVLPQGGPWATSMSRFAAEVKRLTKGQVVFKFYFGAVAGTETRALTRMKADQIQGVAATSAALSALDSSIRVLELPLLYRSHKEFRFVLRSTQPLFTERLRKRGYALLAMASVGWVYIYSKHPIQTLEAIKKRKIWHWKHDPMAATLFKTFGVSGIKLPLTDVLASLQAGTLDTVYGMPHSTQALQWHTSLKYILDLRVTMAIATVVIRTDALAKLTPQQQKIVLQRAGAMQQYLNKISKSINSKAMRSMIRTGLTLQKPTPSFKSQLKSIKLLLWKRLMHIMYRPADLKKVKALLTLCRNTSCSS